MNVLKKILFSLFVAAAVYPQSGNKLTVAVAANVQFAMKDIKTAFEKTSGYKIDVIIGSSGQLTAQIKQGAPFDVFISADMRYPEDLFKNKLAVDSPKVYAYGALVVWTMNKNIALKNDLSELTDSRVIKIAVANPKTAPYGTAAIKSLKHFGLLKNVEGKLVYGESIASTNQFIISGAADIGFTAKSVVMSSAMKGKGNWSEVEPSAYNPIRQGCVVLSYGKENHPAASKQFYDFLFSDKVREILKNYGYKVGF